ncbi:chaperone protein dnaJ 49-like [Canna indica]|uniref:Chaperone protein dnaJ 49-like n=1 Tax=Canna indica TaxID=4628 RepID=A0AAQ3KNM4_9LILI|nr:chaperone protein dnaJ 49-like [Canna indica]
MKRQRVISHFPLFRRLGVPSEINCSPVMDDDRDMAFKCLRIGMEALGAGDRPRALKFLSKARRLDPSLPIDDLLFSAGGEEPISSPSSNCVSDSESAFSTSTLRNRSNISSGKGHSRSYTEEQVTIVQQIGKQKDFYEILGLEQSCTVDDIRRAYRKLSLKVHPDKNHAPGAEEAFKEVSNAFQCLSDAGRRKNYDLCGSDEPPSDSSSAKYDGDEHYPNGCYDDNIDADENFRSFFSGGRPHEDTPFGSFHSRTAMHHNVNFNTFMLIHLILPIIILLLLINFWPSPSPVYMLSPSYTYNYKVMTPRGVPYFVTSEKFEEEYPSKSFERTTLEQHVEKNYFDTLTQSCQLEKEQKLWGLSQTPQCEMLRKYEETAD